MLWPCFRDEYSRECFALLNESKVAFKCASFSRVCPGSLLLFALVIRYRDLGQTFAITLYF